MSFTTFSHCSILMCVFTKNTCTWAKVVVSQCIAWMYIYAVFYYTSLWAIRNTLWFHGSSLVFGAAGSLLKLYEMIIHHITCRMCCVSIYMHNTRTTGTERWSWLWISSLSFLMNNIQRFIHMMSNTIAFLPVHKGVDSHAHFFLLGGGEEVWAMKWF